MAKGIRRVQHIAPPSQTRRIGLAGEATPMPKVLIIQPFHDDGMKLFAARPDVAYEVVDGTIEELSELSFPFPELRLVTQILRQE